MDTLTEKLEGDLMQAYLANAYSSMPIVDVEEVRIRYRTKLATTLPSYLVATLVTIGSGYRSLLDQGDVTCLVH